MAGHGLGAVCLPKGREATGGTLLLKYIALKIGVEWRPGAAQRFVTLGCLAGLQSESPIEMNLRFELLLQLLAGSLFSFSLVCGDNSPTDLGNRFIENAGDLI